MAEDGEGRLKFEGTIDQHQISRIPVGLDIQDQVLHAYFGLLFGGQGFSSLWILIQICIVRVNQSYNQLEFLTSLRSFF